MDFKFEEKINVNISIEEVTKMIEDKLRQEGFQLASLTPMYQTEYVNDGQYPFGQSHAVKTLTGFSANAERL